MKRLKKLLTRYQDVFFPVFDVLLNGFNFFMHIYISWFITLNEYSILNALLSFLAILFVMGISIQTFTNKEVGKGNETPSAVSHIFSLLTLLLLLLNIIMIFFISSMMKVLRTDFASIILIMLIFDVNLVLSFFRGVMQGRQMFLKLNISFYIEVISKLIFIIAVLPFVSGTLIPLSGILIGMVLSLIHGFRLLHKEIGLKVQWNKKLLPIFKAFVHVIWSNFFLYYLTSISLIVANYYIGEEAGLFAVSLKFSQLIMAVGFSVITVLVSYSSDLVSQGKVFNQYVRKWLIRFCLGGIVILAGYQLVVRHMISFLFGDLYAGAKEFMVYQGLGYVMLTIAYFIISEMIIMNQKIHVYILALISSMMTIGLIVYHQSIISIIAIEVSSYTLLFVALLIWYFVKEKKDEGRE